MSLQKGVPSGVILPHRNGKKPYVLCHNEDKHRPGQLYPVECGDNGTMCGGLWCATITLGTYPMGKVSKVDYNDQVEYILIIQCRIHKLVPSHGHVQYYCGVTSDWRVYGRDRTYGIPTINDLFDVYMQM